MTGEQAARLVSGASTAWELNAAAARVAAAGLPTDELARVQSLFARRCWSLWPAQTLPRRAA